MKRINANELANEWMFCCFHYQKPSKEIREDLVRLIRRVVRRCKSQTAYEAGVKSNKGGKK